MGSGCGLECAAVTGRCGAGVVESDDLVGRGIVEHRAQQRVVDGVAAAVGAVGANDGMADDVEIADGVEHLVLDELGVETQAFLVEDARLVHDDGVFHAAALGQAALAQRVHIAHEAEGAGAGDVAHVSLHVEVEAVVLRGLVDRGMVELDGEIQPKAVVRLQSRPLLAVAVLRAHLHRPAHADEALGRGLLLQPGGLQQVDKAGGRAVEDGDFLGVHVHDQVVQPQAGAGREQVLDGVNLGVARTQRGGHAGVDHGQGVQGNGDGLRQIGAAEHDSGIGRRRMQREFDPLAAVQADAHGAIGRTDGALRQHGLPFSQSKNCH
ncbi:conserved hypothetical protein [mine drainage metagenome]|uniref:Uncharacterized protein n=1 Tax=mine drainage metagenome TaxID=410659 RepID=A0A3P3ZR09_9ZZZZ